MHEISVEELAAWRSAQKTFTLLDVREEFEFRAASLPGALHIPVRDVPKRLSELPKDRPVVVFCHHGGRSERVTGYLQSQGFADAVNLDGGIDAWSVRVDPTVPRY